ncbi:MAG: TetR/AcrR family transcriptional regulator [Candidatus Marinimicrobia bacterium]|nr:TetR/AcrR family transcriptional regulator [Candidatus Neomarinimicrobiota bacterium]MCF7903607.1 TetR/AcrR family transcriptional regulator [Candidatus Neomarinimicrobiota bacterium]
MSPLQKDPTKPEAIIRAAIHVFARDGVERGKIADIAKEANIGKGTVYEYFNSKEQIFHAIVDTVISDMVDATQKLFAMDLSPKEKLQTFMRMNTEIIFEMDDAMLIMTEIWAQSARAIKRGDAAKTDLYDGFEKLRMLVSGVLKDGVIAEEFRDMNFDGVTTLCLAFIDGFVYQYMLTKDEEAFERALVEGIHSLMKGLER